MDWLEAHGSLAYAAALLSSFLAVTVWERRRPLQPLDEPDTGRPAANFGLLFVGQFLQYLLVPLCAALAAWLASVQGLGLLQHKALPLALEALLALLALDLLAWALHWALHHQSALWRVHQVHHCDLDYDASLSFRFHPLELALHTVLAAGLAAALGLSTQAVLLAGLAGHVHNVFVHANAALPPRLDALLNKLIVTPGWHRVHHSAVVTESQSNLGIVLSVWDRLAGTALQPRPVPRMGMEEWRDRRQLGLWNLLVMPLRRLTS